MEEDAMKLFNHRTLTMALVAAALSGCGGGGGGGGSSSTNTGTTVAPAALLSASNQNAASQDVASSLTVLSSTETIVGAATTNEATLYATAFGYLDNLQTYVTNAHTQASTTGAVASQSYSCPSGGSYTATVIDADNSGTVSANDTLSLSFSNCQTTDGTLNGGLGFSIITLSGSYPGTAYSLDVNMTFSSLSLNVAAYSASLDGNIRLTANKTGTNAFTQTISSNSITGSATYAGVTRSRTLIGYSATESRTPNATYTYLSSIGIQGTLNSTGFGSLQSVTFSTPTTLVRRGTDSYPYTGAILISGASNTALRLTALSNSQVQEDLDANGDGAFESSSVVNWNTLI